MKKHPNNLEKNISRLVKLTSDSDTPNQQFVDSLIDDALKELHHAESDPPRSERNTTMKLTFNKIMAIAASFIIVAVLLGVVLPSLNKTSKLAKGPEYDYQLTPAPEIQKYSNPDRFANSAVQEQSNKRYLPDLSRLQTKDERTKQPAVIKYTDGTATDGTAPVVSIPDAPAPVPTKPNYAKENSRTLEAIGYGGSVVDNNHKSNAPPVLGDKKQLELALERVSVNHPISAGTTHDFADNPTESTDQYFYETPAAPNPPMAHGGTTPPNGEDVDAMFYEDYDTNPFVDTLDDHLSTFAADVDTGSYSVVRKYLHDGHIPPDEAVRVEEFVNYFDYNYPAPQEDTFAVYAEACPWQFGQPVRKNSHLLRIGLKAQQISDENRKPAILTFVIDVSDSMSREDRLGLVKKSLLMLVDRLKPNDQIGIAVYGSHGHKVMDHKSLDNKQDIIDAIRSLHSEGSTFAEEGIRIGYEMAAQAYRPGCINRVILCSDGVANVGNTGHKEILQIIRDKAAKGITLTTLGFGMGNYNDNLMEQLGNNGDGCYAYIDTIAEAKKLFGHNLTGALQVIARDVKIQLDFNPDVVSSYRLIGYENRDVADKDFRNDTVDGGEMNAGHSTTALYEIKIKPGTTGRVATTYVRYKDPETRAVTEFSSEFKTDLIAKDMEQCSNAFKLATVATEFAEILRKSYWAKEAKLSDVLAKAQTISGPFAGNTDVIELIDLIAKANTLTMPLEPKDELKPQPLMPQPPMRDTDPTDQ